MPGIVSAEGAVLAAFVVAQLGLLAYGVYELAHALVLLRSRRRAQIVPLPLHEDQLPTVTVQLPICNELNVVERLLLAVAALDYPRELLQIQVLDDSTDETTLLLEREVERLQVRGFDVQHLRRWDRTGYKAGNLAHGLRSSHGEFVAILDADFVPDPAFLRRLLPHFDAPHVDPPRVAVVQARLGYLNPEDTLVSRMAAFLLEVQAGVEQPGRMAAGWFINFLGTGGIWRRAAIDDCGGWSVETIGEDFDLSLRAAMRGWRAVYVNDHTCPGEVPTEIVGLRSQQARWIRATGQTSASTCARCWLAPNLGGSAGRRSPRCCPRPRISGCWRRSCSPCHWRC